MIGLILINYTNHFIFIEKFRISINFIHIQSIESSG